MIEVDGEGVHLDTLDAPAVLELTVAYLNLLARCADERGEVLVFSGLRAFEKCGSLGTVPSDAEIARQAAAEAFRLLSAWEKPGYGLKSAVDRVRAAREALPGSYSAKVKVRGFERVISSRASVVTETPWAATSLRAFVQRVGGKRPRATFSSKSEKKIFHLDLANTQQGTELGKCLYDTVDIVAVVVRDQDGNIERGTLREFHPIPPSEPGAAWKEWFKETGVRSLEELEENRDGGHRGGGH